MGKPISKKVIITGASGKIAEAVYKLLAQETEYELILFSSGSEYLDKRKQDKLYTFDLTHRKTLDFIIEDERPDVLINTAAMTNVDMCEDKRQEAMLVNGAVPKNLAQICNKYNCHLITFSTDYIFDGMSGPYTETATPRPLSYYGKTKLAGENAVRISNAMTTIIRTNVVYGMSSYGKMDFVRWIINSLEEGKRLRIIDGQYCNPTFTDDIALGVFKIITKKEEGIFNFAGNTYGNRYQIACIIANAIGYNDKLIKKIPAKQLKQKAERPKKGGLINLKAETALGIKFSTLEAGVINLKHRLNKYSK